MTDPDSPTILHRWTVRKLPPAVLVGVLLIFLIFMAFAYWGVHSLAAVGALATAAVGSLVPLSVPILTRMEYRLTAEGVQSRRQDPKQAQAFKDVVRWQDVDTLRPTMTGLAYSKSLGDVGVWRRFWRRHLAAAYSGEIRVDREDRARLLELVAEHELLTTVRGPGIEH